MCVTQSKLDIYSHIILACNSYEHHSLPLFLGSDMVLSTSLQVLFPLGYAQGAVGMAALEYVREHAT